MVHKVTVRDRQYEFLRRLKRYSGADIITQVSYAIDLFRDAYSDNASALIEDLQLYSDPKACRGPPALSDDEILFMTSRQRVPPRFRSRKSFHK